MKKDWEIKKLGEVCEINIGRTPERGNSKMWDKEKKTDNVWLSIADLNNTENGYISDSTEYVSDNAVPKMKLVKANTLLMSFKLTIGRCAITKRDLFTNEAIAALPINDKDLDLFFLKYYLENFDWAKLTEGDVKVKGKTLNKEKLKEVPITLPPLEEQKRIVKILDEKFAQLETIKTNAQTNLQNAKDLFQSQLAKAFSNTTWEKKRLGDLCEIITGPFGSSIHKTDYVPNGIPMINPQNIVDGYIIPLEKCLVSENTAKNLERFKFVENDIVIARRGEMGRCAVIRKENENWLCGTGSFIIRSNSRKVNSDFLQTILSSKESKEKLEKESIGATMPNLNQGILGNFEIYLPPLPEQKRIVKELDTLSEKVRQLQEIYTKQIANCEELKQSLLQKAFEGELSN